MKNLILKRLTAIAAVTAFAVVFAKGISFLVVDDTAVYTRLMMHELYNEEKTDTLLIGASLFYRGINPDVVNEKTGRNVFVASSSAQPPDASLVILKDVIKKKQVKEVYYYLTHLNRTNDIDYRERKNLRSVNIISDFMPFSLNKLGFLLNASSPDYYIESFFPAKRVTETFLEPGYLSGLWAVKFSEPYLTYSRETAKSDLEGYETKGYVPATYIATDSDFFGSEGNDPFRAEDISEDWKNSIAEIIRLYRENGIRFVSVGMPITDFHLAAEGNYDDFIAWQTEFMESQGAEYVDFNLLSDKVFERKPSYYVDARHFNIHGAEAFDGIFCDYLNGTLDSSAFEPSVKQRLDAQKTTYYGASLRSNGQELNMKFVCNHPDDIEYRVEAQPPAGERTLLQDFSPNAQLTIPFIEDSRIFITYRIHGENPVTVVHIVNQ